MKDRHYQDKIKKLLEEKEDLEVWSYKGHDLVPDELYILLVPQPSFILEGEDGITEVDLVEMHYEQIRLQLISIGIADYVTIKIWDNQDQFLDSITEANKEN